MESGFEYLRLRREVIPSMLPFLGKVKAGKSKYGDIHVDMLDVQDLEDPDIPTIPFPPVHRDSKIIVLEVEGDSMEGERIFAGDFVVVELFKKGETPKQGELIVTRYLPKGTDHNLAPEEEPADESFEGPTLKHYYQEETHIRLSMQRNHGGNEHTIKASQIRSVGRVIGVYRPFSN